VELVVFNVHYIYTFNAECVLIVGLMYITK